MPGTKPMEMGVGSTVTIPPWRMEIRTVLTAPRRVGVTAGAGFSAPFRPMPLAAGALSLEEPTTTAAPAPGLTFIGTDPKIPSTSAITTSIAVSIANVTTTGCVLLDWTNGRCRTLDPENHRTRRLLPPLVVVTIKAVSGSVWLGDDATRPTTGDGEVEKEGAREGAVSTNACAKRDTAFA